MSEADTIRIRVARELGWKWWKFTRPDGTFFCQLVQPESEWPKRKGVMVDGPSGERPDSSSSPCYDTDETTAIRELCGLLKSEGWRATITLDPIQWMCCFYKDSEGAEASATANSLALAICLAFLKVREVKEI